MFGSRYQNRIINTNHNNELIRNASGLISLKKNKPAVKMAKMFTITIKILISLRLIK
jgi:hypothetical protein